jgi:hypothetical protein
MRRQQKWSELTSRQQATVLAVGAIEAVLTIWAARDLAARDRDAVRGPKPLWGALLLVQPVGPVAYLVVGRR